MRPGPNSSCGFWWISPVVCAILFSAVILAGLAGPVDAGTAPNQLCGAARVQAFWQALQEQQRIRQERENKLLSQLRDRPASQILGGTQDLTVLEAVRAEAGRPFDGDAPASPDDAWMNLHDAWFSPSPVGASPQAAVAAYLEAYRGFLDPADQQEALSRLVACAQRAHLAVPDLADRHYRLGVVRVEQKRYPEAVSEFEAALAGAPWLVDAYYNLGLVYDFTGATANALPALRTYVTLAPPASNLGAVKTKIVELEDKLGLLESSVK